MAPLVSVIIPAYNAAGTLQEAVKSVLAQPVRDLEILIVDDGSVDETPALCKELAASDTRIRVFRQENAGISAARNCGLQHAAGQWISFCDDDDMMLPNALKVLLQAVNSNDVDVVRGDYALLRTRADGSFAELVHPPGVSCRVDHEGGFGVFLDACGPQFVWNAIYRHNAITGILFHEECRYGVEDFIFNFEVYAKARTAIYLPVCVYRHYEGEDSTSGLLTEDALTGRVAALPLWLDAAYRAAKERCNRSGSDVWAACQADAVTFLMHQMHNAKATPPVRQQAWKALRNSLKDREHSVLDFLRIVPYRKKSAVALLLFELHLQGLYELIPHREDLR